MNETITNIRVGMRVIDAEGNDVGTVEDLKSGDPEAASAEGQRTGQRGGLWGFIAAAVAGAEPRVPREQAERMLRLGYIKVDTKGFFDDALYCASDAIRAVRDDTVELDFVPST